PKPKTQRHEKGEDDRQSEQGREIGQAPGRLGLLDFLGGSRAAAATARRAGLAAGDAHAVKNAAMAEARPRLVYSPAIISTRIPSWRAVSAVTGPMQATLVSSRAPFRPSPKADAKLTAVEELVKVTTSTGSASKSRRSAGNPAGGGRPARARRACRRKSRPRWRRRTPPSSYPAGVRWPLAYARRGGSGAPRSWERRPPRRRGRRAGGGTPPPAGERE